MLHRLLLFLPFTLTSLTSLAICLQPLRTFPASLASQPPVMPSSTIPRAGSLHQARSYHLAQEQARFITVRYYSEVLSDGYSSYFPSRHLFQIVIPHCHYFFFPAPRFKVIYNPILRPVPVGSFNRHFQPHFLAKLASRFTPSQPRTKINLWERTGRVHSSLE
ncbi:hypothetical protein E2C01_062412 [Portunus trituberculatus]|uniref:Secreted protein n=1 Tax=Portunus trituberculatus TaxID=210409 RepID=A0A5B7HF86_PORTR|nr:hypothetical protein [Portunus trituberculatus]